MLARMACAEVLADACHDTGSQTKGCLGRGLPQCLDLPANCGLDPEL